MRKLHWENEDTTKSTLIVAESTQALKRRKDKFVKLYKISFYEN